MADLSGEESDHHSDRTSSLENSQSESELSLSCEFSSFESGGSRRPMEDCWYCISFKPSSQLREAKA